MVKFFGDIGYCFVVVAYFVGMWKLYRTLAPILVKYHNDGYDQKASFSLNTRRILRWSFLRVLFLLVPTLSFTAFLWVAGTMLRLRLAHDLCITWPLIPVFFYWCFFTIAHAYFPYVGNYFGLTREDIRLRT